MKALAAQQGKSLDLRYMISVVKKQGVSFELFPRHVKGILIYTS
jgi:hypothetical protein